MDAAYEPFPYATPVILHKTTLFKRNFATRGDILKTKFVGSRKLKSYNEVLYKCYSIYFGSHFVAEIWALSVPLDRVLLFHYYLRPNQVPPDYLAPMEQHQI